MTAELHCVTTERYKGTTRSLIAPLADRGITLQQWSWDDFLAAESLPYGAWVLADFERLDAWTTELAALRYDALINAGWPVLNSPVRFLGRAGQLRLLHAAGINSFTCWLPALAESPNRFPVFLRTIAAHRGVLSDLLQDGADCAAALKSAMAKGHPLNDLVFVEYRAEKLADGGHFQKHSAYRFGDRIVRAMTVNDANWVAKNGTKGLASEMRYLQELAEMTLYPHKETMLQVTDLMGCRFGRVDFGLVKGRIEVYEINSNPFFRFVQDDHPSAARRRSGAIMKDQILTALDQLVPRKAVADLDLHHLPLWPKDRP